MTGTGTGTQSGRGPDTIAAMATPAGSGGIGIIKISGPAAAAAALRIFVCKNNRPLTDYASHRLYHGYIQDPDDGRIIDEVLLAVMKGPRSYTGEDVAEIQAHAGSYVLENILGLVLKQGVRMAEPGEYTRRAFLNGRMDLSQAEAVMDIINAQTDQAVKAAAHQARGDLSAVIETMRGRLLDILARAEAAVDFPEDVGELNLTKDAADMLDSCVLKKIIGLLRSYEENRFARDGFKIVIIGRPNVGKSSILNKMLGRERAIVTQFPGTTRDIIHETLIIDGIPVIITDTAGLHDTHDPIEVIGIEKTRESLEDADGVILVMDASCPVTDADIRACEAAGCKPMILALNKQDLAESRLENTRKRPHRPVEKTVRTSALLNTGLDELKQAIAALIKNSKINGGWQGEAGIIPNLRHKNLLAQCKTTVQNAINGIRDGLSPELISFEIRDAVRCLDQVAGAAITVDFEEDVLQSIFSRFCIGK